MKMVLSASHETAFTLLKYALGVTFLWFGILKLFAVSPVQGIITAALPSVLGESELFFFALSLLEILIGMGFFLKRTVKLAATVMIGHVIVATISVLVTQGFAPRFPILSLPGEFVIKNLVLIASGILLVTKPSEPLSHT